MDGISVKHSALVAASDDLQAQANGIEQIMTDLESQLKAKLSANWSGQASEAYEVAKRRWDQGMGELRALLADISRQVSDSNDRYVQVDQQQANLFT